MRERAAVVMLDMLRFDRGVFILEAFCGFAWCCRGFEVSTSVVLCSVRRCLRWRTGWEAQSMETSLKYSSVQ